MMTDTGSRLRRGLLVGYRPLCQRGLLLEPAHDLHAARVAFALSAVPALTRQGMDAVGKEAIGDACTVAPTCADSSATRSHDERH